MQGGRNPNRIQKQMLTGNGYDSKEWLYIKQDADGRFIFKNKKTGEIIFLPDD